MFLTEKLQARNIGREFVFSAEWCYNGADGGIVKKLKTSENNPSVANATAPFTQGSLWICATLGVWALPDARVASNAVIQRRNWR